MKERYAAWIADYAQARPSLTGKCAAATKEMAAAFPELTRVAGWAHLEGGGSPEHWWCVTADGTVVDPTAGQWSTPVERYEAFKPGGTVRVGRCMNCGWDIYDKVTTLDGPRRFVCSDECNDELVKEYG